MTISDHVMIAGGIAHKAPEILEALEQGVKPSYKVWYAVTTALKQDELMYILSSREYGLPLYRDSSLRLLGLAGSRNEAYDIVMEITKSGYTENVISDMKNYLQAY